MEISFADTETTWSRMLPLTYTKPVSELRVGIFKIREKWEKKLNCSSFFKSQDYLKAKYKTTSNLSLHLLGGLLPNEELIERVQELQINQCLTFRDQLLACWLNNGEAFEKGNRKAIEVSTAQMVHYPWDIFCLNSQQIRIDFAMLSGGKRLTDPHTITYGHDIFIEEGAQIKATVLNSETGPIYIGKNAKVQEGSLIQGPFALCEGAELKMGAKIRRGTTIGPHSKVGGEVSNAVIQGFSNKAHDGFLGNAVIGEWCNLGADTNNSNLKNTYTSIKMWDYESKQFMDTGHQLCGVILGDHSKCGINTMFNSGTTLGVSTNIFGAGFLPKFIPSFAWGGADGFSTYQLEKAFETAHCVVSRKEQSLTKEDLDILTHIFKNTRPFRFWENK